MQAATLFAHALVGSVGKERLALTAGLAVRSRTVRSSPGGERREPPSFRRFGSVADTRTADQAYCDAVDRRFQSARQL